MKGILLLSIGNPCYARYTHNMAVSIRANSELPIHIVTDGNYPAEEFHRDIADKTIQIDYSDCHDNNGKLYPAKAKLSIQKYSEFDETLYLDVDGLLLKDIDIDFDGEFQIQVNGYSSLDNDNLDSSLWVKPKQIIDKYNLSSDAQLPGTNSSFIYFTKKTEVFKQALKNLETPFTQNELRYKWGVSGTQPDELYINIALAQLNIQPNMKPVLYLRKRGNGGYVGIDKIKQDRYILGCWGDKHYNHFEISGTGDRNSGLYNKLCFDNYQTVYGDRKLFKDYFFSLINNKVYARKI